MQDAVDAISNDQPGLLRLDVNVARPRIDRFDQDLIDQSSRPTLPEPFRSFRYRQSRYFLQETRRRHRRRELRSGLRPFHYQLQVLFDEFGDLFLFGNHRRDAQPSHGRCFIDRIKVQWIAGRDNRHRFRGGWGTANVDRSASEGRCSGG